jgi:membrane-associated phospholipid phosphatase
MAHGGRMFRIRPSSRSTIRSRSACLWTSELPCRGSAATMPPSLLRVRRRQQPLVCTPIPHQRGGVRAYNPRRPLTFVDSPPASRYWTPVRATRATSALLTSSTKKALQIGRNFDTTLSARIHKSPSSFVREAILAPAGVLFSSHGLPCVLVVLWLAAGRWLALWLLASTMATLAATESLKRYFGRPRPQEGALAPRRLSLRPTIGAKSCAFPSGDSAQAMQIVSLLILLAGWDPRWMCVVPMTMLARVYYGCHWVGDTIAGCAVGGAVASIAWACSAASEGPGLEGSLIFRNSRLIPFLQ